MGVKVCFYSLIIDDKNNIIKDMSRFICSIKASEICSEFIARYFQKTDDISEYLLEKIEDEDHTGSCTEKKQNVKKGIYKVNIDSMIEDSTGKFEFKTFKECKIAREFLLEKYDNLIDNKEQSKIDIYAFLTV